jgi:hypothetical protein
MRIALLAALIFSVAACGSKDGDGAAPASKGADTQKGPSKRGPADTGKPKGLDFPGTMDGAKALLQAFLKPGADYAGMSKALRPTTADYKALYNDAFAGKLEAMYGPAWDAGALVLKPKAGQSELLLFSATTDDFKAGNEKAGKFPGGYKKVANELKPGQTLYRFKFVKPGETLGMAFDGLAHVNGRWVIVPKPWRAMR